MKISLRLVQVGSYNCFELKEQRKDSVSTLPLLQINHCYVLFFAEYEEATSNLPALSEIVRSTSTRWSTTSQNSFSSIKKKIQEATSEIRNNSGW